MRLGTVVAHLILGLGAASQAMAAETRAYAVSWFHVAAYVQEDDCPQGVNPVAKPLYQRILKDLGYTPDEIQTILEGNLGEGGKDKNGRNSRDIGTYRGKLDGQPVDVYVHPYTVPDPKIHLAQGRYANGFDLDGKVGPDKRSSIDPDTQETGVDNHLRQVMGCSHQFHTKLPDRPGYPANEWDLSRDDMPAWVMSVTGEDLNKDGDVTITFDRALEPVRRDANGAVMPDVTYRIDPDARSHSSVPGKIVKGRLTSAAPFHFAMTADSGVIPDFEMNQAQVRFDLQPDKSLKGYLGGYQPWISIYFMFANLSAGAENSLSTDMPGLYYALKRMADYDPDPHTGENRAISGTYRMEMVPAFLLPRDGVQNAVARR